MVTKLLTRIGRWLLKTELARLNKRVAYLNEQLLYTQRSRDTYQRVAVDLKMRCDMIAGYVMWASSRNWGVITNELYFIRDYLRQGPGGPYANTNGVHPASRWGIDQFFKYEEEVERDGLSY